MFNIFFRLSISALVAKIEPDKLVQWRADAEVLAILLRPVFSASCMQHFSDLHPKFALGHTVCGSMVDIQRATAENR